MIGKILKNSRPYLTTRSIGTVAIFALIAHLGLYVEKPLAQAVADLSIPGLMLITDAGTIQALWVGLLAVHAAVGAVAPILGYTLMATTITAASRIAPPGAVIAAEIEWSNYLATSLLLLAGSLVGALSAPSALGLAAAACATTYVVIRTMLVFKRGFDLVERPERFDAEARKYLSRAIADVPLAPPTGNLDGQIEKLNTELSDRFPRSKLSFTVRPTLSLGDKLRATQLLRIQPRIAEVLASEAEKIGCQLFYMGWPIPSHLPRGTKSFLEVHPAEKMEISSDDAPALESDEFVIERDALERLQQLLESSVVFGSSQWVEDFTRLPMLVQRHIATVVYEAIPRQQPHDLGYGLDVLGQLIDEVQSNHGKTRSFDFDVFDWVYEIPQFVCNQIAEAPHSRMLYAREMVSFLRARLCVWLAYPELDNLSRAYIAMLSRLLRSFIGIDDAGAEYLAMAIRELPALARSGRITTVVLIQRALIVLLVEDQSGVKLESKDRRLLIRTMAEVLRYSPGLDKDNVARAETVVSAVAVTLYLSNQSASYRPHLAEVLELLVDDRYSDSPFFELLAVIGRVSEINENWRWSWWELDQKERGQAHFMSMEIWLTRAAIVALSSEGWRLSHLDDGDIPSQQVLGAMLRAVSEQSEWLSLLPEHTASSVRSLATPLQDLLDRRSKIVAEKIAAAPIDLGKVERYVKDTMADIAAHFGVHNAWLVASGAIQSDDIWGDDFQVGTSRLVPREWFVPDEVLDIPIILTGLGIGKALVDFELNKIARAVSERVEQEVEVPTPTDVRIWEYVNGLIGEGMSHLLLIGVGVSQYDVYEELSRSRAKAEANHVNLRFETLRSSSLGFEGILVLEPAATLRVVRLRAHPQGEAIFEEGQSLEGGGVISGVAEITTEMKAEWLKEQDLSAREDLEKRYAESLLDRTAWSFRIELLDTVDARIFRVRLDPGEGA